MSRIVKVIDDIPRYAKKGDKAKVTDIFKEIKKSKIDAPKKTVYGERLREVTFKDGSILIFGDKAFDAMLENK